MAILIWITPTNPKGKFMYDGLPEYVAISLKTIEEEFSRKWLDSGADSSLSRQSKGSEKVKWQWRSLVRAIKNARGRPLDLRGDDSPALLLHTGIILNACRKFPNYNSEIKQRLKDPKEHEKAIYECQIAVIKNAQGHEIEFVKREKTKTPDLRLTSKGNESWVECKNHDLVIPPGENEVIFKKILESITKDIDLLDQNTQISIYSVGPPSESKLRETLQSAIQRAKGGFVGIEGIPRLNAWISVSKVELPFGKTKGKIILEQENGLTLGTTQVLLTPVEDGHVVYTGSKKLWLNHFHSHKVSTLLTNFNKACMQLANFSGKNEIFINFDTSHIQHNQIFTYFDIMREWIIRDINNNNTYFSNDNNFNWPMVNFTSGPYSSSAIEIDGWQIPEYYHIASNRKIEGNPASFRKV